MSQTSKIKNLWGDLPVEEAIRTPYVILKEQASILTEATNGLLIGNVRKESFDSDLGSSCLLRITVPSMENYSVSIVRIRYPKIIYPSEVFNLITDSVSVNSMKCHTEEELDIVLGKILSSKEAGRIISGLLSEVRADAE